MTGRLLALDTTAASGSIALLDGTEIVAERVIHAPEGFGAVIFQEIDRLLSDQEWRIDDIDRFAAAAGPGSFTGVRIGLTTVKALAEVCGRCAVAVSNLRALAAFGTGSHRAAVIDARRGEVYGGLYDSDLNSIVPEAVLPFPQWLASLPHDAEFLTQEASTFREWLPQGARLIDGIPALAGAVGRIAQGETGQDPVALDANYVRRSDAELLFKG